MKTRIGTLVVLTGALALAPAAYAAPTKVKVRVEGATKTLFEGTVTTDAHPVDGNDGSGAHTCDGTNGGANSTPAPTLLGAFDQAVRSAFLSWSGAYSTGFQDFTIDTVGPDSSDTKTNRYWGQALNFKDTQLGGCQIQVKSGDQVLIAFNSFGHPKLELAGPTHVTAGRRFTVTVIDGEKGKPFKGAIVRGRSTGPQGRVRLTLPEEGTYRFKARAKDAIRSNALTVHAS
jgi:hypothetical protein